MFGFSILAQFVTRQWKWSVIGVMFVSGCLFAQSIHSTSEPTEALKSIKLWHEDELISHALEYSRKLQFLETNVEIADYH